MTKATTLTRSETTTSKTTKTTCPKCGKPVELKGAEAHQAQATAGSAANPNLWAIGILDLEPHVGRLYGVCPCTPGGPVLEMPASSQGAAAEGLRELESVPGIGPEVAQALKERGIVTLEDLAAATDAELLALPHIGEETLARVRAYLASRGLGSIQG